MGEIAKVIILILIICLAVFLSWNRIKGYFIPELVPIYFNYFLSFAFVVSVITGIISFKILQKKYYVLTETIKQLKLDQTRLKEEYENKLKTISLQYTQKLSTFSYLATSLIKLINSKTFEELCNRTLILIKREFLATKAIIYKLDSTGKLLIPEKAIGYRESDLKRAHIKLNTSTIIGWCALNKESVSIEEAHLNEELRPLINCCLIPTNLCVAAIYDNKLKGIINIAEIKNPSKTDGTFEKEEKIKIIKLIAQIYAVVFDKVCNSKVG